MKLSEQELKELIAEVSYNHHESKVTTCYMKLKSGFIVTGVSGVLDKGNFKPDLGEKYAYENAFSKLWELEGYAQSRYPGLYNELWEVIDRKESLLKEAEKHPIKIAAKAETVEHNARPELQKEISSRISDGQVFSAKILLKGERLWVQPIKEEDGLFYGILQNTPATFEIEPFALIEFYETDVFELDISNDD